MKLELFEKKRPHGVDPYSWRAFDYSDEFDQFVWHDSDKFDGHWYVDARLGETPVVRMELITGSFQGRLDHYVGVPPIGPEGVRIQLLEVAKSRRRSGFGQAAVEALLVRHGDKRFFALSEADGFWEALGWSGYLHPTDPDWCQKLFIQPVAPEHEARPVTR